MNLDSWFKDKIVIQPMTGVSTSGQPTYGAQEVVKCRVEYDMKKITDASGQEVISDTQIALSEEVGLQDRIWLPNIERSAINLAGESLARVTDLTWQIVTVIKRLLDPDTATVLERFVAGVGEVPDAWVEIAYVSVDKTLGIFTFAAPGYGVGESLRVKSGMYLDYLVGHSRTAQNYRQATSKNGQTTIKMLYL